MVCVYGCVCMDEFICVYGCMYMCVWMDVCAYGCVCICIMVCLWMDVCVYGYVCMCIMVCIYVWIGMHNSACMGALFYLLVCACLCLHSAQRSDLPPVSPQLHVLVSVDISGALIQWGTLLLALERTSFFSCWS